MVIKLPGLILKHTDNCVVVEVTQKIETLNRFLGDSPSYHWKNYRKKWATALNIVPTMERVEVKAYTTIISYRTRLLDKENLYGGSKPIRDMLEKKGWLWNDSPNWGDLTVWQMRVKKGEPEKTYIKVLLELSTK